MVLYCEDKDQGKSDNSTVDLMQAGTTEQCLNAQKGAIEGENESERSESLQRIPHKTLTSCLGVLLSTQEEEEDEALTHTSLIMWE